MKLFLEHPYLTGIFVFLLITIGGSVLGLIIGVLIITNDTTQPLNPSDPNDGAAMASGMISSLAMMASLIFGILAGLMTTYFLQLRRKQDATSAR